MAEKSEELYTEEDELYFGSVLVYFKPIEGQAYSWTGDTFTEANGKSYKELSNKRLQTFSLNGQELILPAIPATDIQLSLSAKNSAERLPPELRLPLIKIEKSSMRGIMSGARSALVKINGEWYRLKGCGDKTRGFPLDVVENNKVPKGTKEIRGCAFEHTTYRELHISDYVNHLLKSLGLECANKPIGWWDYHIPDSPFPHIKRCCILMKTLGNKRLGDNVLLGLEKLLPHTVGLSNLDSILNHFPKERFDKDSHVFPTSVVSLTGEFGGEVDFHDFQFSEMVPSDFSNLFIPTTVNPKWASLWSNCSVVLTKYFISNPKQSIMSHLYWRFGREIGVICRCFSLHHFSWGSYVDLLGFHCNSHINNLVLLPQNKIRPGSPLLAPLDFDMAYTENTFSREKNDWDEWMYLEKSGMKLILAGDTETNSGVKTNVQLSPQHTLIKYALRDTMMVAFNEAFEGKEDRHPPIPELDDNIYSLLNLALILTENETA